MMSSCAQPILQPATECIGFETLFGHRVIFIWPQNHPVSVQAKALMQQLLFSSFQADVRALAQLPLWPVVQQAYLPSQLRYYVP